MSAESWLFIVLLQVHFILPILTSNQSNATTSLSPSRTPSNNLLTTSVFHKAVVAPKYVESCDADESCVFSWACERIHKPVRPCSGPFYFFTVCCKTGYAGDYSAPVARPQDVVATTLTTSTTVPTRPAAVTQNASTLPKSAVLTSGPLHTSSTTPFYPIPVVRKVCGQAPLMSRAARIVGGSAVQYGEFPFQAMVVIKGAEKCGGALLDHQWVVTAGHCVASASIKASDFIVKLGVWDRTRLNDILPIQERLVSKVILHPTYGVQRSFSQDLALLKLHTPVVYGPHIQPVCLPGPNDDFTYLLATITGWGRLQFREDRPNVLQKVEVPVIPNKQCEDLFQAQHTPEKVLSDMMCATTENGTKDACQGDSGGPLSLIRDGAHVLAGLVSWGYGCALPGYPGVYARMSKFTGWLEDTMRRES